MWMKDQALDDINHFKLPKQWKDEILDECLKWMVTEHLGTSRKLKETQTNLPHNDIYI